MKKFFAMMMALVLVLCMAACGSKNEVVKMRFVTGGESGTYFAFGGTIAQHATNNAEGIEVIGPKAFSSVGNKNVLMETVTLPSSLREIGESAFRNCKSLSSITIPDSVTKIVWCAFFAVTSLSSITIPITVTSIEGYAFQKCNSLTAIHYNGTMEQWSKINLDDNWHSQSSIEVIHCSDGDIKVN